jgi:hypothetical protein
MFHSQRFKVRYTVTKLNGLFRAPARMSVIKLFLARNMSYLCGLNKTLCQPGVLQEFLKIVCCTCFQAVVFLEILLPQPGIIKKVRCTCSQTGVFQEYSLSQARTISKFIAFPRKKNCQHGDSIHCPFFTKQMFYHYTTSFDRNRYIFCYFLRNKIMIYDNCVAY